MNKWNLKESERVCGVDIDGVLNYYPEPWVHYINAQLNTRFDSLLEAKMAVPYQIYKDLKYQYRSCGIKENLEVRAGAKEMLDGLKHLGYTILIITSRPFDEHRTLFSQTVNWFNKNQLPYDGIIFGKDKYQQIITQVPNLSFMIDDHRYYANLIAKWGYDVFLLDTMYNQGKTESKVSRIQDLSEIYPRIRKKLLEGDDIND